MKRTFAVLLSVLLLLTASAYALDGVGYPSFDGSVQQDDTLGGSIGDESILLEFDGTADYSYSINEYIQVCFFAFDAEEKYYLELYLMLPESIEDGTVLNPETAFAAGAGDCSITLYEVDENDDSVTYYAGQLLGSAMPASSSFSIAVDNVVRAFGAVSVSGTLNAELCRFDGGQPSNETLKISDARFNFTLSVGNTAPDPQPGEPDDRSDESQELPEFFRSLDPAPAFTLPPDYRKI